MRKLLCLFGLHKRSRGAADIYGPRVTSVCKYCGVKMVKVHGRWQVDR